MVYYVAMAVFFVSRQLFIFYGRRLSCKCFVTVTALCRVYLCIKGNRTRVYTFWFLVKWQAVFLIEREGERRERLVRERCFIAYK